MQLVDDRRLANTRIARDKHQFDHPAAHDTIERCNKSFNLCLASVQFFGDQQPVGRVVRTQRERVDAVVRLPCHKARPEVSLDTRGGLVTVLSRFCE
ncbi:hypothetical protein [Paraburkholderia ginsengiterrae]|uniref:hypothetical protein n=1 Tax=Paraburkholderia ginsengiterrae TaxID=1462993 RepID=UPI0030FE4B3B